MFIYHFKLEMMLRELDKEANSGLIMVGQLDGVLNSDTFAFPLGAVD